MLVADIAAKYSSEIIRKQYRCSVETYIDRKKTLNDNSILKIYIVGVERWLSN